jgi:hypothetical protein
MIKLYFLCLCIAVTTQLNFSGILREHAGCGFFDQGLKSMNVRVRVYVRLAPPISHGLNKKNERAKFLPLRETK